MINSSKIILALGDHEKIIIQYQGSLNEIDCCYEDSIIFKHNNSEIILVHDFLYHNLHGLSIMLKSALDKKLRLDKTITQDLGFLFNQYSAYICGEKFEESGCCDLVCAHNVSHWSGDKYNIWSKGGWSTWIYNNPDGSIIFEVTPFYPFMYCDPEDEPNYIPYCDWIKTYKPYFIQEISTVMALAWCKQLDNLLNQIKNNTKKSETIF